jgi:hypothetical protein
MGRAATHGTSLYEARDTRDDFAMANEKYPRIYTGPMYGLNILYQIPELGPVIQGWIFLLEVFIAYLSFAMGKWQCSDFCENREIFEISSKFHRIFVVIFTKNGSSQRGTLDA